MKIFVYGTLKRGHGNFEYFLKGKSKFLGEGFTNDKFHMRQVGFPVVLPVGDPMKRVSGEVFEIDVGPVLAGLDRLEGNGSMYQREERKILWKPPSNNLEAEELSKFWDNGECEAWIYLGMPEHWHGYESLSLGGTRGPWWEWNR